MESSEKRRQRRNSGTVTLRDVAAAADVSMITVSRVLNRESGVSDAVRARVQEAVRKLGYVKNRYAGSLASVRTNIVTAVLPSLSSRVFSEIIRGADSILRPRGYQILVSNTFFSLEEEEEICRQLLGWSPEGMIIAGIDHHPRTRELLLRAGVPVVEALELGTDPIDINIGLSHFEAGHAAADYLVSRGYRRPGFVGAEMVHDFRAQRRRSGYMHRLQSAGLAIAYECLFDEPTGFQLGAWAIDKLLEQGNESVDAIFCVNDEIAIGAIGQCVRRGVSIPDELAIIGFNDLDISGQIYPGLTTIRSPRLKMGQLAAQAILDRIDGKETPRTVDVRFQLVVRESA